MRVIRKRISYFLSALWYAFVFFYFSLWIYQGVADFDVFYATIWNTILIVGLVIWDKVEERIYVRIKPKDDTDKPGILRKIGLFYFSGASFKTALYLFYFVMLICNALVTADPDFPILRYLTSYFSSVYYGILILFAADSFLTRLLDDAQERRVNKMVADLQKSKAEKKYRVEQSKTDQTKEPEETEIE